MRLRLHTLALPLGWGDRSFQQPFLVQTSLGRRQGWPRAHLSTGPHCRHQGSPLGSHPGNHNAPGAHDSFHVAFTTARETITKLAKQKRHKQQAWSRLGPLIDLALRYQSENTSSESPWNVADVGTDHGLLAFGLAVTNCFDNVTGVELSEKALQEGALATLFRLQQLQVPIPQNLGFAHGDGLHGLNNRPTQVVCLAGMGVNTMERILSANTRVDNTKLPLLDELKVQVLLTQPTNARPRNLIHLYQTVYEFGFEPREEIVVRLDGRWYVSTAFVRRTQATPDRGVNLLPQSHFPLVHVASKDSETYRGYLSHMADWLLQERRQAGRLRGREDEWLDLVVARIE